MTWHGGSSSHVYNDLIIIEEKHIEKVGDIHTPETGVWPAHHEVIHTSVEAGSRLSPQVMSWLPLKGGYQLPL